VLFVGSERDHRALEYLVSVSGSDAVLRGYTQLPGRTRPYVSNIAKALGVVILDDVVINPREEGRRQLAEIEKLLSYAVKPIP
jgi:hypothetical protein